MNTNQITGKPLNAQQQKLSDYHNGVESRLAKVIRRLESRADLRADLEMLHEAIELNGQAEGCLSELETLEPQPTHFFLRQTLADTVALATEQWWKRDLSHKLHSTVYHFMTAQGQPLYFGEFTQFYRSLFEGTSTELPVSFGTIQLGEEESFPGTSANGGKLYDRQIPQTERVRALGLTLDAILSHYVVRCNHDD